MGSRPRRSRVATHADSSGSTRSEHLSLAARIASYPADAVAAARQAVDSAALPLQEGLKAAGEFLLPIFTSLEAVRRATATLPAARRPGAENSTRKACPAHGGMSSGL